MNEPHYRYPDAHNWREFIGDKHDVLCSHKQLEVLGNFTPLLTNGVIAECRQLHNDAIILIQLSAIAWPKPQKVAKDKPEKKSPTPRARRVVLLSIEDLL